jgi:co-chaperonin GroES (HSP10)
MISPLKNHYLISANEDENEHTESGIWIDRTWDKYKHAVQCGIIESSPLKITTPFRDDVEINKGDKVYFHHFVVQQDNYVIEDGKKLFQCPRFNLYCVVKNGIPVMVDDWVLVSPILETESDIIKTFGTLKLYTKSTPDELHLMATAEFISKQAEGQGIIAGDIVVYKKDADYDIMIEGKKYYRMKLANVVAVIRNNKLLPLRNDILVADNTSLEERRPSGIILPINPKREQCENILAIGPQDEKQFTIGEEVLFFRKTGASVEHEKIKYIVLRQEEIAGSFAD